jgi:hypothetical protein
LKDHFHVGLDQGKRQDPVPVHDNIFQIAGKVLVHTVDHAAPERKIKIKIESIQNVMIAPSIGDKEAFTSGTNPSFPSHSCASTREEVETPDDSRAKCLPLEGTPSSFSRQQAKQKIGGGGG